MFANNNSSFHRRCLEEQLNDFDSFSTIMPQPSLERELDRLRQLSFQEQQTNSVNQMFRQQSPFQNKTSTHQSTKPKDGALSPEFDNWSIEDDASPLSVMNLPSPTVTHNRRFEASFPSQPSFAPSFQVPSRERFPFMTQLPTTMASNTWVNTSNNIYQVQFKHNFKNCTLAADAFHLPVEIGSFVITSSDNGGQDLGIVTDISSLQEFTRRRAMIGMSKDSEENSIGAILHVASIAERQQLAVKREREEAIMPVILQRIHEKYRFPMEVKGVEFQFDGRKLTVHFVSDIRIDFRELVRELNNLFQTRVWLKKTNQCSPFHPKPFATVALATGCVFSH